MPNTNFQTLSLNVILIAGLLILGVLAGILIGLYGISPLIAAAPLAIVFFIITVNKPLIALFIFFLLVPLENLYVFDTGFQATSSKLVGAYLVFLVILTGNFKYIPEVFKNRKTFWIIGYVLAVAVSLLFSDISQKLFSNLTRLIVLVSTYFVLLLMVRDIKTLRYCFLALIIGSVLSVLSPVVIGFGNAGGTGLERYAGLWGDENTFATILLMVLPLSFVFYLNERKQYYRFLYAAVFLIILGGFFLTYSRGGFVALVFLAITALFKVIKSKNRTRILIVVVPILIVSSVVFYNTIAENYISRIDSLRALQKNSPQITESSLNKRYIYNFKVGPKLFSEDPIFGKGLGGFIYYNTYYKQVAHNTYLEVLTGSGIVGFIPFIMILYLSWRELRNVQYATRNNKELSLLYNYSTALELGFLAILVAALFLSLDLNKIVWITITMTAVIANITRRYIKNEYNVPTPAYR